MAEVYRAKSLGVAGFEKLVAIKRVLPELATDNEFVDMFIEEAKIAGQLQHANIAGIYELGKIDDVHFIAMEYVFGKNLRQIMESPNHAIARLPPSLAAWIATQVLAGLDYAHRKRDERGQPMGIIHRDVSPPNVIVSYDGHTKIVDFGIAKARVRAVQTVAGVIKGKLSYMSPEQLMGDEIDHRSDVFAAAVLLHELLTGKRLFDAPSDFEVTEKVRMAAADPPSRQNPNVTPELDAVVMRGLAASRNERWQSAGEMQEALVRAVARPGIEFSTAALRDWMRVAFAEDHARERDKLERMTSVRGPGVELRTDPPPPPTPPPHVFEFGDEPTTLSETPAVAAQLAGDASSDVIELSSLVEVDESFASFEDSSLIAIEVDTHETDLSAVAALRGVGDGVPAPSADPDEDATTSSFESEPGAAFVRATPPDADGPTVPQPGLFPDSEPSSHAPTTVASPPASEPLKPPSVKFKTLDPAAGVAPPPPPEASESRATSIVVLLLTAVVALLLGVGGVVLWLVLSGRGLPF